MGMSSTSAVKVPREQEVFRAFRRLDARRRRRVALRILRDQRVLADLYDHILIEEALRERGKSASWDAYLRRRKTPKL